jgi:lactate dehydrogenase-like 2-hydroxyacid dehydrogenase
MKQNLVITRKMPPSVAARAELDYDVRKLGFDGAFEPARFLSEIQDADAILVTPADKINAEVIQALPATVKVIGTFSVGTDHVDLAAAKARNLPVVHTPDVLSFATAEIALTLMLMAARRAGEGERVVRGKRWGGWQPDFMLGTSLQGKRLGVLGMGRIGRMLAGMARGLSMEIHYRNRTRLAAEHEADAIFHHDDDDFLSHCDVLSIHLPGGAATQNWLNAERIARLPKGAIVVNTGRGGTVDDEALVAALKSGHLAAAGLDVFKAEPNVPEIYLDVENVVLLPHLGSATHETRAAMGMLALDGIDMVLAGREPHNRAR